MTSRQRVLDAINHKGPDKVHIFLHSCGSVAELLPDLIDIGVEIINPVQTSANGMEPKWLKKEFGRDITFWGGGCDTQQVLFYEVLFYEVLFYEVLFYEVLFYEVLFYGTPQEIDRHVKERIEIFAPGGGFVFAQIHNIMSNVPPENIVAMYEAARKYR